MDIHKIPIEELLKYRQETIEDIKLCKLADALNLTKSQSVLVLDHLQINERILKNIEDELQRRGVKI